MKWIFCKNDAVPQTIEEYPIDRISGVFGMDVLALKENNIVQLYPIDAFITEENPMMIFNYINNSNSSNCYINGMPTYIHNSPINWIDEK